MISLQETFLKPDSIKNLSAKEVAQKRKNRAEKLREKLGIPKNVSSEEILQKESQLKMEVLESLQNIESEVSEAEGNIAEMLANASENGTEDEVLATLKNYYTSAPPAIKRRITREKNGIVKRLF
jgi:phage gp29-like protein